MIDDLRPYPEYKESGLPWLGIVPQHWRTERAKWLFTKMARPVRQEDEVVTCFRDGMVTLRRNRRLRGYTEATAFSGYQGIRKGDLVIHGMDAFAGAIGVSDSDGKGTPVYNVCQPKAGVDAYYYAHLIRQMSQSQWILALAKGIRERSTDFRFEMFGGQPVPVPPPEEQAAIVRFLNWSTGRLERAIKAKRKVIALLNEQKQTIIHRAVTRGLDPEVLLKPSGLPWLGDIPQHWECTAVWQLFEIGRGKVTSNQYIGDHPGPYPLYSSQTANDGVMGHIDSYMFDGDYLTWTTDGAHAGTVFRRSGKFSCTNVCGTLKAKRHLDLDFMCKSVGAATKRYVRVDINPKLMNNMMARIRVVVPPLDEQRKIAVHLNNVMKPGRHAIACLEREIELLREYRTRLVADVVTGKLDVREAASKLPDDIPFETTTDDSDVADEAEMIDDEAD
jgi:type I restriction enzyme S subunit